MKLTRFTNQTPPRNKKSALDHEREPHSGRMRTAACDDDGRDRQHLQEKPRAAGKGRMSSIAADETRAHESRRDDQRTGPTNGAGRSRSVNERRDRSAAADTAMPPPCGVGILWLERAFGRANA